MKTTLEPRNSPSLQPETRPEWTRHHHTRRDNRWAATCATAGAAVWAGIAVLARAGIAPLGAIELLFLLAPLVIVPLGMELSREIAGSDPLNNIARRLQPLGAALAVLAMWLPPGRRAGLAAMGWLLVCLLMAGSGVVDLVRTLWTDAKSLRAIPFVMDMARVDLAVGGGWLVASRLGMRPMGIQEPIGLLTAVHFHFAGFATALIAAATLQSAERRGEHLWLKYLAPLVAGLPFAVAAGFVVSPVLKMVAALLFSISVAALAIAVRACGRKAEAAPAWILLQVAAGAIFAGMVLAGAYVIADYAGSDALTIPQMARTHGILNAIGFCLPGLLGWLVEFAGRFGLGNTGSEHSHAQPGAGSHTVQRSDLRNHRAAPDGIFESRGIHAFARRRKRWFYGIRQFGPQRFPRASAAERGQVSGEGLDRVGGPDPEVLG